ncbi:helix-turn-helix domain-containing protein [Pseudonocardia sp. C8]|uniref:PucR family transcriptional regulator n=1 Tax=Pseudonocardia sp. C8 TaxID=2762759 RepID=UPI0016424517|nr:helix-turn-helix domain-containing protein [Pseudonocardia sp. C8]MBC3190426.1 helix-turn-helix domain-containing protein [Pseudonocardia sp. C8]
MTVGADDRIARAVQRLGDAVPRLARETIRRYAEGVPRFAEAGTPAHLDRESAQTVRTVLRVCIAAMTDPEPPTETAVREVVERGADRVAEGLPLREYLRCWHIAFDVFATAAHAEIGDDALAWPVLGQARRAFDAMLRDAADGYDLAARDLAAATSGRDSEIITALFAGAGWTFDDPGAVPERVLVVLLHIEPAPGEDSRDPLTSSMARRRKVRLLRAHLVRELPDPWLVDVAGTTGRLLVTTMIEDPDRLVADLTRIAGARITMAIDRADGLEDVPRAARTADEALRTAVRHGMRGRSVWMSDVALEHHLTRDSASRPLLLDRCREVVARTELLTTLRSFVAHDLDRRATARDLFVHPNTVDNRLARIKALTGLDVHVTRDLLTLVIAALSTGGDGESVIWSQPPVSGPVLPDD